ncbi:uncharacterized protein LOC101848554 [Aplysia californica]|uniref:Uncharacterized protein LOC101848554 n=1 Tax=Aplysia californica TaxID=6500 RepID=A0ABM0K6B1_APLCA|nr:uncharacterized protein LOC101848554 [Aplysia californica]
MAFNYCAFKTILVVVCLQQLSLNPVNTQFEMPIEMPIEVPVEVPNIPVEVPNIPVDLPDVPVDLPDIPIDWPKLPVDLPDIPADVPKIPEGEPKIPAESPNVDSKVDSDDDDHAHPPHPPHTHGSHGHGDEHTSDVCQQAKNSFLNRAPKGACDAVKTTAFSSTMKQAGCTDSDIADMRQATCGASTAVVSCLLLLALSALAKWLLR